VGFFTNLGVYIADVDFVKEKKVYVSYEHVCQH